MKNALQIYFSAYLNACKFRRSMKKLDLMKPVFVYPEDFVK